MLTADNVDSNVELWKIKRLIKSLESSKGNGTSMISVYIPPKKAVSDFTKMLNDEVGAASNIKSAVNKKSVITALQAVIGRLKMYRNTPDKGLVVFCGEVYGDDGKTEKKILIDFEPFKPITIKLYHCDDKFHVEPLKELLHDDEAFGFIVVDGQGALYATLKGNNKEVIHQFTVQLPKKHGRGGQSSVRFARLRVEKRHNYLRKVAETATQMFISNDRPNVSGLILAGSADFKNDLNTSDMFDPRLKPKVLKIVDVAYGGENGLNQAIELSQECLSSVKFVNEKKILTRFYERIDKNTKDYAFGVQDTMQALTIGAVETLLIYENLDRYRVVLRDKTDENRNSIVYLSAEQLSDPRFYQDPDTKAELEPIENILLTEWIAENYSSFGISVQFITDKSAEGFQFIKGFGGIGGLLRYDVELDAINDFQDGKDDDEDDFI
jgi:peptide chain release factor subunit 1